QPDQSARHQTQDLQVRQSPPAASPFAPLTENLYPDGSYATVNGIGLKPALRRRHLGKLSVGRSLLAPGWPSSFPLQLLGSGLIDEPHWWAGQWMDELGRQPLAVDRAFQDFRQDGGLVCPGHQEDHLSSAVEQPRSERQAVATEFTYRVTQHP